MISYPKQLLYSTNLFLFSTILTNRKGNLLQENVNFGCVFDKFASENLAKIIQKCIIFKIKGETRLFLHDIASLSPYVITSGSFHHTN